MMHAGPTIRGVIFDLDGTLVDSIPVCLAVINGMLNERGSPRQISYSEARPFASFGGLALVSGLLGQDCGEPSAELATFRARYAAQATPCESLYPGTTAILEHLTGRGISLAICSNKPEALCVKVLEDLRLKHYFNAIVGSSASLEPKPDPAMLDETLYRLGLEAEQCMLVGDSEVDIALAASREMACLFVQHGYGVPDASFPPSRVFDDLWAVMREFEDRWLDPDRLDCTGCEESRTGARRASRAAP